MPTPADENCGLGRRQRARRQIVDRDFSGAGTVSELTEAQQIFVREYVSNGGRGAEAARAAGYSEVSAGKYAYQLLEKPHVAEALRAEQKRALGGKLSTMALAVLEGILSNDKAPFGVRVDAAKAVLDRGGLNPP